MVQARGVILVVADDPLVPAALIGLAADLGLAVDVVRSTDEVTAVRDAPTVIVADVSQEGALDAVSAWRERWPGALLAGSLALPRRDLWDAALAAGYDLVTNRGALPVRLRTKLASWSGPPIGIRIRVVDVADIAGRLGVVARVTETPVGPLAVYHVGGQLFAARDVCPHAGAQLSRGELDGPVVTCPLHGSQFDVRTGDRLRGPADDPIATYPIVIESGIAYVEVPQP